MCVLEEILSISQNTFPFSRQGNRIDPEQEDLCILLGFLGNDEPSWILLEIIFLCSSSKFQLSGLKAVGIYRDRVFKAPVW